MYNRLALFFQKHQVFYKNQFGFRKNYATNNALMEVMNYIYKSLDEGNCVWYIYGLKEGIWYGAAPNTPVQTSALWNTRTHFSIVQIIFIQKKTIRSSK